MKECYAQKYQIKAFDSAEFRKEEHEIWALLNSTNRYRLAPKVQDFFQMLRLSKSSPSKVQEWPWGRTIVGYGDIDDKYPKALQKGGIKIPIPESPFEAPALAENNSYDINVFLPFKPYRDLQNRPSTGYFEAARLTLP